MQGINLGLHLLAFVITTGLIVATVRAYHTARRNR
jgi:hypothetical protein